MRDFLKKLFALPKYKLWNVFLLMSLALLANLQINNFYSFELARISNDFYALHSYLYVGFSVLVMIILLCNKFRGKHCWYFLGILVFDFIMICAQTDSTPYYSIYWLGTFICLSLFAFIIGELINIRHLRLNIKPSRWAIATKAVFLLYLYRSAGAVLFFYLEK